jgi:hypothetical protein
VDFAAKLSEDQSNSWDDEASISANDPNNVSADEDEYYDEETKPKKRFDKDDGAGVIFKKSIIEKKLAIPPASPDKKNSG